MQWEDAVPSEVLRHYDFMFDNGPSGNGVPVGNIPLPQSQHPTLEAEWIIYFFDDKGMPSPDDIKPSKHVWLTGMAEAKYMQSFLDDLKSGHILWGPMTVKNDVIAKGDCIETTIDDIANGRVDGEVIVNEITASGEKPFEWRNHARSLRKEKLVEYLQELSKHSQKNQHKPVDFVNLSATDPNSALVNSWPRRIKGIGKSLSFSGEKILQSMFSDAIRKGHYTKSGDLKVIFNGDVIATAKITTTP
ncbi:MAG TPA: hypothetical protein VGL70_17275 [Candidatus Binatia bacterium]